MVDSDAYTAAALTKTQGVRRYAAQLLVPCIYGDEPPYPAPVSRSEARAPANLAAWIPRRRRTRAAQNAQG
jgi:hypothetical protein